MMVSLSECLSVTLLLLLQRAGSERFEVLSPSRIVAAAGDDIILPCHLKPNISAEDMTVDWIRPHLSDNRVHRYQDSRDKNEDQIWSYRGRTSLFKEELRRGNTSLKLTRVQGFDNGTYTCFIQSKVWYDDSTIQLYVKAVGSQPVVSIEGHREGGMGLLCESKGWHPEPEMVWQDSEGVTLSAGPPETHRDYEGLYTVKLSATVQETDTNNYICRVQLKQTKETLNTEFHIPSELFDHTKPWKVAVAVSITMGALTVIGLAVIILILCKVCRSKTDLSAKMNYMKTMWIPDFETTRQYAVVVTLDPDTAHPSLILSEDGKQVSKGDKRQDLPDNPRRFDKKGFVLGREGFSSRRFYYEVEVKGKTGWRLGVASESITRKGDITLNPSNGYWLLVLKNGDEYEALNDDRETLSLRRKPQKVGVFVDYEAGQVSFFNVEASSHMYTFTGCMFTGVLYPLFSPCDVNSAPLIISQTK